MTSSVTFRTSERDMVCPKYWRWPRRFLKSMGLFLLGILTCFFTLQLIQFNDLNFNESPMEFTSSTDRFPIPCNHVNDKGQGHSYYEEVFSIDQVSLKDFNDFPPPTGFTVWVVTPTFYRPEQRPELTRLAQALRPVSTFVHWIVVDDISQGSERSLRELQSFLERFPLTFTLLTSLPPRGSRIVGKPRGVGGRRAAIAWLRQNAKEGVVYFADDDNTYDSDIFRQIRDTEIVSMWPVGLVTSLGVSSPIVKNGHVIGFYDGWKGHRTFPVDMAGFAINFKLFLTKPNGNMPWVAGYEEDELLKTLGVTMKDIVPLANNCTEILVWHTKTARNSWPTQPKNFKPETESGTNLKHLLSSLPQKALAGHASSTKTHQSDDFSIMKFFFGET